MNHDDDPAANSPEDIGYRAPPPAVMPTPQRRTTMATKQQIEPEEETFEGPRGFSPLLHHIDDGELLEELSRTLQDLSRKCGDHSVRYQRSAKGTLTLTLSLTAIGNTTQITGEVKTKEPKAKRAGSTFWRTPGGNLTVENPRQQKLALREVPASTTKAKDISTEAAPVRGI